MVNWRSNHLHGDPYEEFHLTIKRCEVQKFMDEIIETTDWQNSVFDSTIAVLKAWGEAKEATSPYTYESDIPRDNHFDLKED